MVESDITGNISSDCENPTSNPASEMHHPDCTCDGCCESSRSIREDNDCAEDQQVTGGKKKMRNKLVPILANCVVLLAVIVISGRIIEAAEINLSRENTAAAISKLTGNSPVELIKSTSVEANHIDPIQIRSFDRSIFDVKNAQGRIPLNIKLRKIPSADIHTINLTPSIPIK
jgi:hypothetical protein